MPEKGSSKIPSLAHARLVQKGEYQIKIPEVPSSILTGGTILLPIFFVFPGKSGANIANFVCRENPIVHWL